MKDDNGKEIKVKKNEDNDEKNEEKHCEKIRLNKDDKEKVMKRKVIKLMMMLIRRRIKKNIQKKAID